MTSPPKATTKITSKLLSGLGASTSHPLASIPLPGPVDVGCGIRDYEVLGSYNWLDSQAPTIIIPGQPRIWQEPSLPLQLSPDRGYTFLDQNAWRSRDSPLEALFRSISVTQKSIGNTSFSLSEQRIDVVTDRNNLRKLSAMVRNMRSSENLTPSKSKEFRVDAQLAPNGRTLLLTRYSDQPRQMINQGDTSYGASFERATTSDYAPILMRNHEESERRSFCPTSYHRIVKYGLADLNLLVRYEVDAAQPAQSLDNLPGSEQASVEQKRAETQLHSTLRHLVSGSLISQDRIIELKTGTSNSKLKWNKIRPQMYFSQTPILKVGIHQKGKFSKVEVHEIDENYNGRAVESNQDLTDNLRFLVPALKQMRYACQQHGHSGKPLAFFWSGAGPLQLYEIGHPKRSHNLPKDILESL